MLRQFPVKSALPFPLPFGMIQRLARLLVQDLERGSVVGKRGKTDGNRNRTGHILMREGRRTYPGQQALGGLFSDNARHNADELIPDAGSHIGIAELFLQDGPHPPEDNIPGAVAERIVDAPEIVDVHDAEEKGLSPAKTGFSLLTRALRVSRPVSPSCSALRFKSLCAKRNRLVSVSRWRPVKKVFILNLLSK